MQIIEESSCFPEISLKNYSKTFFIRLFEPSPEVRERALQLILEILHTCLQNIKNPPNQLFLCTHLPFLQRLSAEYPHSQISSQFSAFLTLLICETSFVFVYSFLFTTLLYKLFKQISFTTIIELTIT